MKKILSIVLTISMLLCHAALFPMGASAKAEVGSVPADYTPDEDALPISTLEELMYDMYSGGSFYLTNDIDCTGEIFSNRVIDIEYFSEKLDGCGYAIKGVEINSEGDAGLFNLWFKGTLVNIKLGTEDAPFIITSNNGGASVGVVAATSGTCSFDNVSIFADIDAQGKTAGFMAYMNSDEINIENCEVNGNIKGGTTAGFVVASSSNEHTNVINIKNCANYASISSNTIAPCGGIYTRDVDAGENRTTHLTITGCVNYGNVTATDWRVGGIVGEYSGKAESTLLIDHCYNLGTVTMINDDGFAGGIIGGIGNNNDPTGARIISNCYNAGEVIHENNDDRYYDIAYYNRLTGNYTVKDCIGLYEKKSNQNENAYESNLATYTDKSEILPFLASSITEDGVFFMADVNDQNNGYPILSWQLENTLSQGTVSESGENAYTIGTEDFSAFVSLRDAGDNKSDVRFVLATNYDVLAKNLPLYMTVSFANASGETVKSTTKNVATDLSFYASATAAGNTYTAAEGTVLSGIVITAVPNNAWATATITLATSEGGAPIAVGVVSASSFNG